MLRLQCLLSVSIQYPLAVFRNCLFEQFVRSKFQPVKLGMV